MTSTWTLRAKLRLGLWLGAMLFGAVAMVFTVVIDRPTWVTVALAAVMAFSLGSLWEAIR